MKYKNNPLNIRYSCRNHWKGMEDVKLRFCCFIDIYYGLRAGAYILIKSYRKRGLKVLYDIIYAWAPPTDNNPTKAYAEYCAKRMNSLLFRNDITVDYTLKTQREYAALIKAMARFEQGSDIDTTVDEIEDMIKENRFYVTEKQ